LNDSSLHWLIDDPQRNLEAAWVPIGSEKAVIVEIENARSKVSFLDVENSTETFLPQIEGNLLPLAPVGDGTGEWLGSYYSARQPSSVVRFDPAKLNSISDLQQIAAPWSYTNLKSADLYPAEDYRWRSVDGLPIQGWLYRAKNQPARGTVVYVHGGPTAHSADRFNAQIQFLVTQGFNVLDPNYRGSTGFGLTFQNSIKEDGWGGREQEDIRTGIEQLIADGIAQAGKVGVTGTSYGGYSSWCAITRYPPEIVAAAAPICGMTDLVVDYETTRPDLRPYSEEMLGGRPDQLPQKYYERSPLHFVGNIKGKLLIVQGLQDPNVTPANVQAVKDALDKAGITYEVLEFEDEGHGISRTPNNRVLYLRLAEFFSFTD
jgi:dipeptidyl aminopeptidase/acylaminoacyl peptidase